MLCRVRLKLMYPTDPCKVKSGACKRLVPMQPYSKISMLPCFHGGI